jgi:error-prone DNA polymerase
MFVELHARSAFSFLEAASVPEEMAIACAEAGMPAAALLDVNGVYGAPRFHQAAKKAGIKAHVGATIESRVTSHESRVSALELVSRDSCLATARLPLLAASQLGYQNLCRLITRTKLRAPKNAESCAFAAELQEFAAGLICLTGGEDGPLAAALAQGGLEAARRTVEQLLAIYGRKNVYVELQRHFTRADEARNQAAVQIARTLKLPLIACNAPQYALPRQREILDVLTCVRAHTTLDAAGRRLQSNSERYLKSAAEMEKLFADLPEAIAHTGELSSRLEFSLAGLGYQFPRYPVPAGETMASFLRQLTEAGFQNRYGAAHPDLRRRANCQIERELALIEKLELAGYFLIVWDIVRFCREQNILVQGRGSAANSAVCYALGITAVDPVGMDLLFERFLSEERGEWPDIDLDLPSGAQRERAIQYVYQRYGKLGAAMTANVITYRGRLAAREMGKAMGFDPETLNRLSAVVGKWEYKDPGDTLEHQLREGGGAGRHPRLRKFLELCLAVQDLPRHLGQHSGGMVICQGQLDSVVPLEPASMPGRVVVQWDKEDCADLGIIKVDLLGLGMMAVLEESLQLIHDHYGEKVDLAHLPPDDPRVYAALQKADTVGMFQVESRAQMSCLPRLRPERFYDIVVQVAIIRPGPIVGKMVHPYLRRRQGREPVMYPHPALEPVLARTLGVPLFQEQLLRMAMITAGFTGGEAEELRRALGFKRSEKRMREVEVKLRAGMDRNGITGAAQDEIVTAIRSFALYGFPESHSASFALLAYASAFLKTHYLAAFTAALLNHQPMGFYSPATIVKDAQRHGLRILPIDVTQSEWQCSLVARRETRDTSKTGAEPVSRPPSPVSGKAEKVEGNPAGCETQLATRNSQLAIASGDAPAVRLGLCYARGLREEAVRALVRARQQRAFGSIDDLVLRVPELRKSELVLLAEIGALNGVASRETRDTSKAGAKLVSRPLSPVPGKTEKVAGKQEGCEDSELATRDSRLATRRDALWQVELAVRRPGPLLEGIAEQDANSNSALATRDSGLAAQPSPLARMTGEERLVADFCGTGLTVGPHPMAYRRREMDGLGVRRAVDLATLPSGKRVRAAGSVITRQRPGTAKGFVFLSLEDETGIANAIITPALFEQYRHILVSERFLLIEGVLQNLDHVVSVKAERILPLHLTSAPTESHDFY